jgi:hypothetical protein
MIHKVVCFVLATALLASGIFILTRKMHGSPNMVFGVLEAGATLAFAGAVWIWEDFLGPWLHGPDPDLTPPRPRIAAIEPRRWRLDNDN